MPWVLSGCRISSNLTNERKQHVGGDTRRQCKANKGPKGTKGKANRRGHGCAPEGLPGDAQGRQRSDWRSGELAERDRAVALRRKAMRTSRGSGGGLRSWALGLRALSKAEDPRGEVPCLCGRQQSAEKETAQEQSNRCADLNEQSVQLPQRK